MLSVTGLTKTFRRGKSIEMPLSGANFEIQSGEISALMGKSGEGKSTIARILCGTLRADAGSAIFDGETLFDGGTYNRKVGFGIQLVPQQPYASLDPRMKLGASVAEPMLCRKIVKSREEARMRVRELFRETLLEPELMERLPSHVSGGQAQRAAIARVLGVTPRLLIADEATSMLDPASQETVLDILHNLVKLRGISILLISHDQKMVEKNADRIYVLSGGRIEEMKEKKQ